MKRKLLILFCSIAIIFLGLFLWRGTLWFDLIEVQRLSKSDEYSYVTDDGKKYLYLYMKPIYRSIPDLPHSDPNLSTIVLDDQLEFRHNIPGNLEEIDNSNIKAIKFSENKSFVFLKTMKSQLAFTDYEMTNSEKEYITNVYGKDFFEDDYNVMKTIFETTPADLSLHSLLSNEKIKARLALMELRKYMPSHSGIFTFETNEIRGLQLNSFSTIGVYDIQVYNNNNNQFDSFFFHLVGFTQEEIDQILGTMRFLSNGESGGESY